MDFFKFLKKGKINTQESQDEILDLTKKNNGEEPFEELEEKESFQTPEEKRKKLAKRLIDITEKLEDLSNQIYHLGQRVEVLEKKTNVNYQN